jgi:uncharacterized membrane protein SpoIIM required for sporulation
MLESLVSFSEINRKPHLMFLWAFIICLVAVTISYRLPLNIGVNQGFMAVVFTIIPSIFFITSLIRKEEKLEEQYIKKHQNRFWGRHKKDILVLLFYFAGLTAAFSVSSFFVPDGFFLSQEKTICKIIPTGCAGDMVLKGDFIRILTNNLQVLFLSFLFSFIFGAGAVFILAWNASVLGVRIAQLSKEIWHTPLTSLIFLPHGIPEIAGYIFAALAGGLLSASIIRKNDTAVLKVIAVDIIKILTVAVALIFLGAAIEVYL